MALFVVAQIPPRVLFRAAPWLFGIGIVEPVDDLRTTNPPRNEELLAALADAATWRRQGDVLVLAGSRQLRFRLNAN
jgi:hypothetical protein